MSDDEKEKTETGDTGKTPKEVVESKTKEKTKDNDNRVKQLETEVAERDTTISELKKAQKEMESALTKLKSRPEHKGFFHELHAMLFGED